MVNPINSLARLDRCSLDLGRGAPLTRGTALTKPETTRVTLGSLGALYDHLQLGLLAQNQLSTSLNLLLSS